MRKVRGMGGILTSRSLDSAGAGGNDGGSRWRPGMRRALLVVLLLAACSDPHAAARAAARDQAEAELATDPGAALRTARAALTEHGSDPALSLVAGLAHLRLEQRSEAIKEADVGLSAPDLPPEMRADLNWV